MLTTARRQSWAVVWSLLGGLAGSLSPEPAQAWWSQPYGPPSWAAPWAVPPPGSEAPRMELRWRSGPGSFVPGYGYVPVPEWEAYGTMDARGRWRMFMLHRGRLVWEDDSRNYPDWQNERW